MAVCVFILVLAALWPAPARSAAVQPGRAYLQTSGTQKAVTTAGPRPAWAPLVTPGVQKLIQRLRHLRPGRPDPLAQQLTYAGLDQRMTPEQFIALRLLAPLALFGVMILPYLARRTPFGLVLAVAAAGAGCLTPDQWLRQRVKARQDALRRDLPSFLTTLAVLLDAGLNLLPALAGAAGARGGPLAVQWQAVLHRVQLGTPVAEALEAMAACCGVSELTLFVSALVQSLEKGASGVSEAVRGQARQMWALRQQAVQEKGQEVSQDLFLVLLLLAFPAIAIFLLGPVGISLYRFFTHQ